MKRRICAAVCILFAFSVLCSCAAEPGSTSASPTVDPDASATTLSSASTSSPGTPTPSPSPAPSPTREPGPTAEEVEGWMRSVDILEYLPEDTYVAEEGQRWYEPVIENEELTLQLPDRYTEWLNAATGAVQEHGYPVTTNLEPPTWPMLAAILSNYRGDTEGMREALYEAGGIEVTVTDTEDSSDIVIESHQADPATLFYSLPVSDATNAFSLLLSYAYLATVFDESLQGREGIGEPELEQLMFPMARAENYYFVDCWGDPRDGGARRHTGTDINAPEGTDLLACVDGVILDSGTNPVAGNYIVLQGLDGTQYHYYHMVTPSDVPVGTFVSTGDVIGHVGNTGNSRANHLHFTIVTADGHFLNPYRYLLTSQAETIAASQAAV